VADYCEHGKKSSISIKVRDLIAIWQLKVNASLYNPQSVLLI
jgi:hypothetical protein